MGSRTVSVSEFDGAISEILHEYGHEVEAHLREDVRIAGEIATRTTQDLAGSVLGGSGKYAGGWTHDTEYDEHGATDTTHNTSQPSLTHLLEKGHMDRGGGWVAGRRHIAEGAEEGFAELERRLRR